MFAMPLGDVCVKITDGSHASPKSVDDGFPMASVKDMSKWGIDVDSCRNISEDDYLQLVKNGCQPEKSDVLIAKDGSYLKHIFVCEETLDIVLLSSIAILRPGDSINPHILSYTLKREDVLWKMKNYVSGAVLQRIILKDFKRFPILLPPEATQSIWFDLCKPMIQKIWSNNHEIVSLSKLRDVLLPKLLSGELRVADTQQQVADAL